jgi:hypothetical protein
LFSYSTEYYVPPPVDQYLKFKNRCSLLHSTQEDLMWCRYIRYVHSIIPLYFSTHHCANEFNLDIINYNEKKIWKGFKMCSIHVIQHHTVCIYVITFFLKIHKIRSTCFQSVLLPCYFSHQVSMFCLIEWNLQYIF